MEKDQFNKATKLLNEKIKIKKEILRWENYLVSVKDICFSHFNHTNEDVKTKTSKLDSNVPEIIFDGFRTSAILALKLRIEEIDREFENL